MTPTEEQAAIRDAKGRIVRINARAGTGKTTTLQLVAAAYPRQRILYLVFNRQAREEARRTFPRHVDAQTVHALAFRHEGHRWKDSLGHFSPADLLFAFRQNEQTLAVLSHDFLTYFLNSPFDRLEQATHAFCRYLPERAKDLFSHEEARILAACRTLATAWNTGQKRCPHDFYLKICQKSGKFQAALARYDLILVDEAQDLSPIMSDALTQCRQRVFLVGDSHQQIYSFRYAIDAMQTIACDEEFELSRSFRFGAAIAEVASVFIQEAKQQPRFRIHGNQQADSRVALYDRIRPPSEAESVAALTRTNVALFEDAMQLRARNLPFRFEKDLYPLLLRTLDVYWLAAERAEHIRDPLIRSFRDLDGLERFADETENFQLRGMIEIVETYASDFPGVVFEFGELAQHPPASGVILSTIHSAKGREYDRVYIHADMAENLSAARETGAPAEDEINIAYVGMTRAKRDLCLPPEMCGVLTPKWERVLTASQHPPRPALESAPTP